MTQPHWVELGERRYPVHICHEAEAALVTRLVAACPTGQAFLVTDETVFELHAARICAALRAEGLRVTVGRFEAGEAHKTRATVHRLQDEALEAGVDRRTPVVAIGGGIPGDVGGFVAATLLRGLPFIQVPTTLLAMVDSSVGGKTGVNTARGKNLVGAFHQPEWVHADVAYLSTLPEREVRAGLAEAIKHAALARPECLESWGRPEVLRSPVELMDVVAQAVAVKAEVVEADEREGGRRQVLNFGHTLGHAIEAAVPGRWRHGEAVALGMAFAAALSTEVGTLPAAEARRLLGTLADVGLPTDWRAWIDDAVLDRLASDKKIRGQSVNVVLLGVLGDPQIRPMPLQTLRAHARRMAAQGKE